MIVLRVSVGRHVEIAEVQFCPATGRVEKVVQARFIRDPTHHVQIFYAGHPVPLRDFSDRSGSASGHSILASGTTHPSGTPSGRS